MNLYVYKCIEIRVSNVQEHACGGGQERQRVYGPTTRSLRASITTTGENKAAH